MIGANTLKAAAVRNPSKRVMRAHERDAEERIMRALDKLRRDVTRGMTEANVLFVPGRLRHRDIIQPFIDSIVAVLRDISLDGAGFGRGQIERAVFGIKAEPAAGFAIDWELVNTAAEEWARRYGFGLVRGIIDTTSTRLQSEIANWTTNNESIGQLARRLAEPNGPFGLTRARTIAVTETTRAYAEGNRAAWRESKVVKRNRWNTSNDEAVCPICGPLHNAVADLDQPFPGGLDSPPAHPNCRCWLTPVVDGAEDLAVGINNPELPAVGMPAVVERVTVERQLPSTWQPAKTQEEINERFAAITDVYEFSDLKLDQQNSILKAAEDVLGSRGLKLDRLGYQTKKAPSAGRAMITRYGKTEVEFQKTYVKSAAKKQAEQRVLFESTKQRKLSEFRDILSWVDPEIEPERDRVYRGLIESWERCTRWAVGDVANDPIEALAKHEFYHVVDFSSYKPGVSSYSKKLGELLYSKSGQSLNEGWDVISQYGASSPAELFAELGSAIDLGIPVPERFYNAMIEVLNDAI